VVIEIIYIDLKIPFLPNGIVNILAIFSASLDSHIFQLQAKKLEQKRIACDRNNNFWEARERIGMLMVMY